MQVLDAYVPKYVSIYIRILCIKPPYIHPNVHTYALGLQGICLSSTIVCMLMDGYALYLCFVGCMHMLYVNVHI